MSGSDRWRALGVGILAVIALGALPGTTLAAGDDVRALSLGVAHRCALTGDGHVWCWGYNDTHQIGDGTTDLRTTPVEVQVSTGGPLRGVKAIARTAGDHTCALKRNGTVRCWGRNTSGELGDGTTDPRSFPVTTLVENTGQPLTEITTLAVADNHGCARRSDGTAWCWGYNGNGRLGDGTTTTRLAAVQVRQGSGVLTHVTALATGSFHTCAVLENGTVRCWGENTRGQLGDGTTDEQHSPVAVRTAAGRLLRGVVRIAAGYRHTCALLEDRTVRCWGANGDGQDGDGTRDERHHPVKVRRGSGFLTEVTDLSAAGTNTCAVTASGAGWCWGDNSTSAVGDGTDHDRLSARRVLRASGPLTNVRRIATSGGHSCAVRADGSAWCWGYNEGSNLGTGDPDELVAFAQRVRFP